eukprot:753065-Hanusia_phi.AAC.1
MSKCQITRAGEGPVGSDRTSRVTVPELRKFLLANRVAIIGRAPGLAGSRRMAGPGRAARSDRTVVLEATVPAVTARCPTARTATRTVQQLNLPELPVKADSEGRRGGWVAAGGGQAEGTDRRRLQRRESVSRSTVQSPPAAQPAPARPAAAPCPAVP